MTMKLDTRTDEIQNERTEKVANTGCRLGPSLEMLFQPATEVFTGIEDTRHHAVINSKWIVDCTA
jgi:hypothetical protein